MYLVWFLVIGSIAGWLAGKIMRGSGFGLLGDLLVGIAGAFVGGMLFRALGIATYSLVGSLVSATIGAIILIWLIRVLRRRR